MSHCRLSLVSFALMLFCVGGGAAADEQIEVATKVSSHGTVTAPTLRMTLLNTTDVQLDYTLDFLAPQADGKNCVNFSGQNRLLDDLIAAPTMFVQPYFPENMMGTIRPHGWIQRIAWLPAGFSGVCDLPYIVRISTKGYEAEYSGKVPVSRRQVNSVPAREFGLRTDVQVTTIVEARMDWKDRLITNRFENAGRSGYAVKLIDRLIQCNGARRWRWRLISAPDLYYSSGPAELSPNGWDFFVHVVEPTELVGEKGECVAEFRFKIWDLVTGDLFERVDKVDIDDVVDKFESTEIILD